MEIIVFSGGLGNQMFQYAFYLSKLDKSEKIFLSDYSVIREGTHNGIELERLFHISLGSRKWFCEQLVRIVRKLLLFKDRRSYRYAIRLFLFIFDKLGVNVIREKQMGKFMESYLDKQSGVALMFGFWQSEKYFASMREVILKQYHFVLESSIDTTHALSAIRKENSVSIHIRRGDYLSDRYRNIYGDICTIDYYKKAVDLINEQVTSPSFYIFSDDIDWAKKNIDIPCATYVDWNNGENSWQDMYLMSQCKHNIIANSSFSWWSAWLNPNQRKVVISPSRFLNTEDTPDLIPESWVRI